MWKPPFLASIVGDTIDGIRIAWDAGVAGSGQTRTLRMSPLPTTVQV